MDVLKDITDGLRGEGGNRRTDYEQGPDYEHTPDRERDDGHLCAFCQHEFDAERGACPDCGAEIVLRGGR